MAEGTEKTEKKNGGRRPGSGMKKGHKTKKVLEREASRKAYEQLVLKNLKPLFYKQLLLAMGQIYVYRRDKHGTGASMRIENVLLENPREIADALDTIANNDPNWSHEDGYVYVVTKSPENRAIDSMLDRSIGKPMQSTDITSNGEKIAGNTIVLTNFKDATDSK